MFIVQCRSVILTGKEEKGNFNGKKEGRNQRRITRVPR
ncbi:hypothetical protein TNCV_855821, partial [Trichonephila clavipes]